MTGFVPAFWIGLPTLLMFVGSRWFRFLVFGAIERMSASQYERIENHFAARGGYGSFIAWNTWVLVILQAVRNLALTLAWLFYILRPTTGVTLNSLFVVVNSLVLSGTVFYQASEALFWQARCFGWALALRTLEVLTFIAALIVVAVELSHVPTGECCGAVIALLVVLIVIVLHGLLVLWPRTYLFMAHKEAGGRPMSDSEKLQNRITGSAAQANPLVQPLANTRASHAAFGNKRR